MSPLYLLTVFVITFFSVIYSDSNAASSENASVDVVELSTETFEDYTQAASGNGEGFWLVLFHEPGDESEDLQQIFDKLALTLKDKVHFGKVNMVLNEGLRQRFRISGSPVVYLFREAKMYRLKGGRSYQGVETFALKGHKRVAGDKVPPVPGKFDDIVNRFVTFFEEFVDDIKTFRFYSVKVLVALTFIMFLAFAYISASDKPPSVPVAVADTTQAPTKTEKTE